jgi:uncharacterized protein Yka (UPF0111/DUF47 family)
MTPLLRARTDNVLLDLFEESGRTVQRAGLLLRDLLDDYPENAHLARDLFLCEQDGDRITHDIIHRLSENSPRRGALMSSSDGHELATALDDIVDLAEEAADTLGTYHVEAPMEQSVAMAEVLVGAAEQIADALRALRTGAELSTHLVEIHRLENEGDRISRAAIASLFANGIDPMVVIRWKDIFEALEAAVDACERVAHLLEGLTLRRRR